MPSHLTLSAYPNHFPRFRVNYAIKGELLQESDSRRSSGRARRIIPRKGVDAVADVFRKQKRSWIMSLVKGARNKSTEEAAASIFRAEKITGWRRRCPLAGKPDFVFRDARIAVFIDGCFWHHCPRHGVFPGSNRRYWKVKIKRNQERDREVNAILRGKDWKVLRIWECELKDSARLTRKLSRLRDHLAQ